MGIIPFSRYVDQESQQHTDSSLFPTNCILCSDATPDIRKQNPVQCPTPSDPSRYSKLSKNSANVKHPKKNKKADVSSSGNGLLD